MDFQPTDEQRALGEAVRRVLEARHRPAELRRAYGAEPTSRPAADPLWATLAELGAPGLLVAPERGGLGLGLVELVEVCWAAGRVALWLPLADTAGLLAPLLGEVAGTHARAPAWLEALSSGQLAGSVGGLDMARAGLKVNTERSADVATTPLVPAACGADLLALAAPGADGPEVHLVAPEEAEDVEVEPVATLDPTRRVATVRWRPGPATLAASGPTACVLLGAVAERAAVVASAQLAGLAEAMIEGAAAYAKERRQFGRPIGSFQAIKHHLADARIRLEFTGPAVYRAAWSADHEPERLAHDASLAKSLASDTAELAAATSLQVHGAIGYTWEADVHLWMKRAWALAADWGDAWWHRRRLLALAPLDPPASDAPSDPR